MAYIPNPKTEGSGILCATPQTGYCPNACEDCFVNNKRGYLEPIEEHLPNLPPEWTDAVVRVNDANDSNVQRELVVEKTKNYKRKFYNTSIPRDLEGFPGPVVLTVNPGGMTNLVFHRLYPIPKNLMFVRFRANTFNQPLAREVIKYYTSRGVPVVMTWMAYNEIESIPLDCRNDYIYRKRTMNEYWAIRTDVWKFEMNPYRENYLVYNCGKIEGELGKTGCKFCGNCLREYFATMERMKE